MRNITKIISIALIFTLIGMIARQDFVCAEPRAKNLRVPLMRDEPDKEVLMRYEKLGLLFSVAQAIREEGGADKALGLVWKKYKRERRSIVIFKKDGKDIYVFYRYYNDGFKLSDNKIFMVHKKDIDNIILSGRVSVFSGHRFRPVKGDDLLERIYKRRPSGRLSQARDAFRPAALFKGEPVETYDFPADFIIKGRLNPITLWFKAICRAGLEDKVVIGVKGSLVQSGIEKSASPFWPVVNDIDLSFYIDAKDQDERYSYYNRVKEEFKKMLTAERMPWDIVRVNIWADEVKDCIQIGSGDDKIHFETEDLSWDDLFKTSYGSFQGPLYKYYGSERIMRKTSRLLRGAFSQDDLLKRLSKTYDIWLGNLLSLKTQKFLLGKNDTKPLKILAWLAEMRNLGGLKKEILEKVLCYEDRMAAVKNDARGQSDIRGSMIEDMVRYAYILVPADSAGGKTFYEDLSQPVYRKFFKIDAAESIVSRDEIDRDIRKHYQAFVRQAGFNPEVRGAGGGLPPVSEKILADELNGNNPWKVARDLKHPVIPLFISTEHASTYAVIMNGIEEGFLKPENTVVINFDRHEDMANAAGRFPMSNNWLRILLEKGKVSDKVWFDGDKHRIEDFNKGGLLKNKDIVISIDMDYFENIGKDKFEEAVGQLERFVIAHGKNIKVISIALSPDYCPTIKPETAAKILCKRLNVIFSSNRQYLSMIPYLTECGVCLRRTSKIHLTRERSAL
ncbi:MAG: hypothetical protein WC569_00345 [Candidatus Omnitrophota bacterium]